MTDQNYPSSDLPPQPPQQSFGSAPPPASSAPVPPGTPLPPGAPAPVSSFGEAPPPADMFGQAPPPPVVEKKKSNLGKILGIVAAILVVVCVGGIFAVKNFMSSSDPTKEAKAGTCIGNLPAVGAGEDKEAPNATVVDCGDANAAYKVEGRVDNVTEAQATAQTVCDAFTNTEFQYRAIDSKTKVGYVLCLSQIKK